MAISKRVKLDPNVLLEWVYDDYNVKTDNYTVITNVAEGSRSYVSALPLNSIDNNLFTIDSVLKRYSKIDLAKFNFLQKQDYAGAPIPHDNIKVFFPVNFNFTGYQGFNMKVYTLDYANKNIYTICNYYYDKANDANIGTLGLVTPFNFNEKVWGKCIQLSIPSIYNIAKARTLSPTQNTPIPNTINSNLTNGVGLSQTAPIFIDFSFIVSRDEVLGSIYYTLGSTYAASLPQQPEYQSLGVEIVESTQGDYFEIYGIYQGTNENLDNFVADLEAKGKKIEIEYTVTLYEEGIQSGYPQTFVVSENFSQKLLYRPIIRFSNTTAAIDITMRIKDLVNNSEIERFASIGLTKNIFKYGKTLSRINIDSSITKPKIYKAAPENITYTGSASVTEVKTDLVKVPYPLLHDKYKILVNSTNSINSEYKSNGLLNIIITPFDTIIKFVIAKSLSDASATTIPYDLSEFSANASLKLVFKSAGKSLEKEYFAQTNDNNFKNGIIVYKITESDLTVLKDIYNKGSKNFYLTLSSSGGNTLLYSGKYEFYDNVKFVDLKTQVTAADIVSPYTETIESLNKTISQLELDKSTLSNSLMNVKNIPYGIPEVLIKDNASYFNLLVFVKRYYTVDAFESALRSLGIAQWIYNDFVYFISGLHISIIQSIESMTESISAVFRIDIYDGQNEGSKKFIVEEVTTYKPATSIPTDIKEPVTPAVVVDKKISEPYRPPRTCFTPDTMVEMGSGDRATIDSIRVGDIVKSYSIPGLPPSEDDLPNWDAISLIGYPALAVVRDVLVHEVNGDYVDINSGLLHATREHMVMVKRSGIFQFLPVIDLVVGDFLCGENMQLVEITSKELVKYAGKVYNLTLDEHHVYFANGVLVHNKKIANRLERLDEQY